MFVLAQIGHIWSEPARPDPARPSRFWDAYILDTIDFEEKNYQRQIVWNVHKIHVSKFHKELNDIFEDTGFFVKT